MKQRTVLVVEENTEASEDLFNDLKSNGYQVEKIDNYFPKQIRDELIHHCSSVFLANKKDILPIFEHHLILHYINTLNTNQLSAISALANSVTAGLLQLDERVAQLILLMKEAAENQSKFMMMILGEEQMDRTNSCSLIKAIDLAEKAYLADILEANIKLKKEISPEIEIQMPLYIAALAIANVLDNAKNAIKNLYSNRDFVPHEEGEKFISFVAFEQEKGIVLRVSDNGTGISNEIKERIFDKNFSTKNIGGGWGLSLTREALSLYRASIDLDEENVVETTFVIKFQKIEK